MQVHTDVVNRKTTITTFPDITVYDSIHSSDSDGNEENMVRSSKRHKVKGRKARSNTQIKLQSRKPKVRNCDKCHNAVANDIDMYRFYYTGLTVCKNCWITIDPSSEKTRRSRQIQSNLTEMKLCTVFLTDVLSQELYRKKKTQQVEKDKDTSDNSSQEEEKSFESSSLSISSKTKNHLINGKARLGKKRKINMEKSKDDVEYMPLKVTKLSKKHTNTNEVKLTRASVNAEQQSSTPFMKKSFKRLINRSSDSDSSAEQRETRRDKLNDCINKTNKKKHKSTHEETTLNARLDSSDETSNEDCVSLRSKMKSATRLSINKERKERSTRSRTRSSSMSSTEISPKELKSSKALPQSKVKSKYACDKCNKKFDTKLSNAKHKLTHLKQAALKLEKITISDVKEKQETEVDSQNDKISIEAASYKIADKQTDDLSEEIGINIEDTDDEEIFSLVTKRNLKRKLSEDSNETDKPDTANSESRESENDENIETKEFEQCKKSTVVSDETEDDEDRKNKDTRNKRTTKDTNKTSANSDSDKSKDKDVQKTITVVTKDNADEEKDKNVEIEKVGSTENEKTINECNNDKQDLHAEIMSDSETIKTSSHNITKDNKNHGESCKSNLENCEDNTDEIIKESEILQNDLIDESSKKDTKEPKEKLRKILPTDKIETFNSNERDLDDAITINKDKTEKLEERQNESDEENMEVEITANVDVSGVQDIIKQNVSNHEKHDSEIKDSDENIKIIPVNSNDDRAKCKKIMEEMAALDDSKLEEKEKFEEQIKELEELVNDNPENNKHREVQENSTYVLDNNSADAANEILKEVFELAAAEVQQREENSNMKNLDDVEMETLENISREIRKSADMPSLDPISVIEIDDNDIMLN